MHAALTNVRSNDRGGLIGIYADLRPLPVVSIQVLPSANNDELVFSVGPHSINLNLAYPDTTVTWHITDHVTGAAIPIRPSRLPVKTATVSLASFAQLDTDRGLEKTADATVTINQPAEGVSVTGTGQYTWYATPPVDPCNPINGSTGGNIQAAVNLSSGGTCPK